MQSKFIVVIIKTKNESHGMINFIVNEGRIDTSLLTVRNS